MDDFHYMERIRKDAKYLISLGSNLNIDLLQVYITKYFLEGKIFAVNKAIDLYKEQE